MGVLLLNSFPHLAMFKLLSLLVLLGLTQAANNQPKDLLCDICLDVVTDIDEWLTSDQTMDDIIHFVEGLCSALGAIDPTLETLCKSLIEAQLPDTINGLVEDNLNPSEVCASIGMCYTPPPPPPRRPPKIFFSKKKKKKKKKKKS